jgi:hypothetical protein
MKEIADQFEIKWIDRGRPPVVAPNPKFPHGIDLDMTEGKQSCLVKLPYPTGHKNIGLWMVECKLCGNRTAITAASRPDDPRSARLICKIDGSS